MISNELKHSIGLTGIQNARELGGYVSADGRRVRGGVFLRTAKLSPGTEEDFKRLRETYRLAKIFDLRADEEINGSPELAVFSGSSKADPDPEIEGAEYFHLPVIDLKTVKQQAMQRMPEYSGGHDLIQLLDMSIKAGFISDKLYFGFLDGELGRKSYSRLFREIITLKEGSSVLFHCTQGKDRTGVAAMLILSALDVPEETVVEDYMLTNEFNRERIAKERAMLEMSGRIPPEKIDTFLMAMDRVSETTMTNVIAHLKESYGSVKSYIVSRLGVSGEELEGLKDRFLV